MKKLILSMLALGAMMSCAKDEPTPAPGNSDLTPISLYAGVEAVTRAGAGAISTGKIDVGIAGWESETAPDYTQAFTWNKTAKVDAAAGGAITWTDPQPYYNAKDAVKTYMLSWYPAGTWNAGKVTFADKDGRVDAMVANKVSGSKESAAGAMTFAHKTTKFVFNVEQGTGLTAGTTLTSITVNDAELPNGIDFTGADPVVTFEGKAALPVPGIAAGTEIPVDAVAVGQEIMIKPIGAQTFTINVVTSSGTFNGITVSTPDASFLEGKAYTITLTFNQKSLDMSASVTPWTPDGEGTGEVE